MTSDASCDPMDHSLDLQNEMIRASLEFGEAHPNTEDLYSAPSPIRDLSEVPVTTDSCITQSIIPQSVVPEDADIADMNGWVPDSHSKTTTIVPETKVEAEPIDVVNFLDAEKVDNGECFERPVLIIDEVHIKEEDDQNLGWTWRNAPNEIIFISDDEHDAPSPTAAYIHDSSTTIAPAITSSNVPLRKTLLLKRKQKQRLTPAQIAKMEEIQKVLAEKATGRSLVGAVGSLFKDAHTVQEPTNCHTPPKPSENDWMDLEASDSDEDRAEAFRQIKKNYDSRKKKHANTAEDEIMFMRAAKAENSRLGKIEKDQALQKVQDEADTNAFFLGNDEGLFVGEGLHEGSSLKRSFETTLETDLNVSDPEEADFLRQMRGKASSSPNKRQHHGVPETLDEDPGKDGKSNARKAKAKPTDPTKPSKRKSSTAKDKKVTQPSLKKKKTRKSTAYKGPSMTNFASLVGGDVMADAQANAGKRDQPTFTDHRKLQALNELVASLPAENRKIHLTDKNALLKATQRFNGHGAMKSDGNGRWKLRGMKTSLYHYQLLGAAFMRDRENGQDEPLGGILADEMGFGKTVMTISCMVDGRPAPDDEVRTTLIIATPALVTQWMKEIAEHTEEKVIDDVIQYSAGLRLQSNDVIKSLQKYDCVVTTFAQVLKSYPKYDPPKEIEDEEQKQEWWVEQVEKYKGPLHRIMWHRIVIDEAHLIKNHKSRTAIACCGLMAKHRWLLTGTPIQNDIEEFFSYFSWLKINHTGSFQVFKKNFCAKGSNVAMTRLHSFLNSFMCRRTHVSTMFGAPILKLPPTEQRTTYVEFTELERSIYDIVSHRFIERINGYAAQGIVESKYRHIFTLLLRLRQMTGHILTIQGTIEDLLEDEDIEKLRNLTVKVQDHTSDKSILLQLRKMLANSKRCAPPSADSNGADSSVGSTSAPEDLDTGGSFGVVSVNFDKYLRTLHETSNGSERNSQQTCCKCRQPAEDPWITSCQHVFCHNCLLNQHREANQRNDEHATCCGCGLMYISSSPFTGLPDLNTKSTPKKPAKRIRPSRDAEDPLKWIEMDGQLLPSAKTTAIKAQIVNWKKEAPGEKIIVFTIFHDIIRILSRIFDQEEWGHCEYHGRMTHTARNAAISRFEKDPSKGILLASLKCGGVGLNLVMATKVFNVDLWWNSSVEQQAYCRVFRIGQKNETHIQRVVVRGTIDEKLLGMQKRKDKTIKRALGDDGKAPEVISVPELLGLFGRVGVDDNGKAFIWPDDEE
ncbi:hypothetical protein MMC11_001109 [Xylographa trunciseda]|nr:hypothetical protein [Xylographa trunciseda]